MADELNTPNHRYYQNRYNVELAPNEMSKQWILASGIARIDNAVVLPMFAASEPGTWYDPSDLTTLFQDNAGTTPVTGPNQPVGLMLDKSQGATLGPELVANGTFDSATTGWTALRATLSVVSGALRVTGTAAIPYAYTSVATVVGKKYLVNATLVADAMTGNSFFYIGTTVGGADIASISFASTPRTQAAVFTATTTTTYIAFAGSSSALAGESFDWDNISCKETTGNPATQTTSTQRPIYGINPITGTRNLLTYTEQFDNAIWAKAQATTTANSTTAPDGTTTADTFVEDSTNNYHTANQTAGTVGATETYSFYAKAAGRSWVGVQIGNAFNAYFDVTNGVLGTVLSGTASISAAGNGWYRCAVTATRAGNTNNLIFLSSANGTQSYLGNGTSGIYVWGAQLEQSATATAYQKVVSQYEVTEAGVQSASYLAFDGVDDSMVTGTITPGIDKGQVFIGLRKLSNAARAMAVELLGTGVGTINIEAPSVSLNDYSLRSGGTTTAIASASPYSVPITNVVTGLGDISAPFSTIRVNGVQRTSVTTTQGTGNYLPSTIYIGRRGGSSLPFNGRLYSLITRFGANLTDGQITSAESYVNAKTGAY